MAHVGLTQPFEKPRQTPWDREQGADAVLRAWRSDPRVFRNLVLDHELPARDAQLTDVPRDLPAGVRQALEARGITRLFSHQAESLTLARRGRDLVVATPTASGKSLCFNLPILEQLAADPGARALYLFPTKALSRDQEQALRAVMVDAEIDRGAITYDGDTPGDARRAAREHGSVVLTNPDMLHAGMLPHHAAWARLFANLRFVVIDELHTYRGVMGSHLANVIRRLRRIADFHGSRPTFICASATIGNPQEHAAALLGGEVELVGESGAPAGPRQLLVYNPPVVNEALGIRASYTKTAVRLAADLIRAGVPSLVFGQSRNTVEVMLKYLRDRLAPDNIDPDTIQGYRGGYLPGTRRTIEHGLRAGEIRCVVATNALELGIDIGMLDAVVCAGYPGTIANLYQRFGRAGRRGHRSLAILVASSAPLDQFFALSPRALVGAPIEHARIDPDNVEILVQHLKCAAFELPFTEGSSFGNVPPEPVGDALGFLADNQVLHAVPGSNGHSTYHWSSESYPANHVSLRSAGWDNVVIIDRSRDQTIGELDWRASHTMLHEQAIYQQDGAQYQVEQLDLDNRKAFVRPVAPDYFTTAMTHTRVSVIHEDEGGELGWRRSRTFLAGLGDVSLVEKVVGFKKIKFFSHENVGYGEVHLPEMQMHTTAFWLTVPEQVMRAVVAPRPAIVDALRGLSHAMHTVAAIGLMIDPRDLGRTVGDGASGGGPTAERSGGHDLFTPTIFLYDHVPGGVGLAARIWQERDVLMQRARALVSACDCEAGCPGCVGPLPVDTPPEVLVGNRKHLALAVLEVVGVPGG
jgi:DEAD/DEAH box helicase domain-containing protein